MACDDPFIAEIRLFAFGFTPPGWRVCDGSQLSIAEHQPLFAMLGWRFGGDGWTTFGLPHVHVEYPHIVPSIATRGILATREQTRE